MDATERYLRRLESTHPSERVRAAIDEARADARGEHGPAGSAAISAELVRLTLGGKPDRPELLHEVDTGPCPCGCDR